MQKALNYRTLSEADFSQIVTLALQVHGDGYVDIPTLHDWLARGISHGSNAGFVVYDQQKLVGFRITFAPKQWLIDNWCSPHLWGIATEKICYFKCNTVNANYRGLGIGGKLLQLSVQAAKKQGAQAGVAHLWRQSPGNSAVKYFSKCGGRLIKSHPDKWHEDSLHDYACTLCGHNCHCDAEEMLLDFNHTGFK